MTLRRGLSLLTPHPPGRPWGPACLVPVTHILRLPCGWRCRGRCVLSQCDGFMARDSHSARVSQGRAAVRPKGSRSRLSGCHDAGAPLSCQLSASQDATGQPSLCFSLRHLELRLVSCLCPHLSISKAGGNERYLFHSGGVREQRPRTRCMRCHRQS